MTAKEVSDMTTPVISVVIPTYNRAAVLERLLRALARCEMPSGGAEFIVVDDGSPDDTQAVLARSALPGLVAVRQDNAGAAAARNRGWRLAHADVVAFTDDDCVPEPGWLVEIAAAFRDADVDAVGARIEPLVPGVVAEFVQAERLVGHGGTPDDVKYLVTANAAYRRSVLEALDGFDDQFPGAAGEDTDLTMRARDLGFRLVLLDRATVAHDHRTSVRGLLRTYYRHGRAWKLLAEKHPQRGLGTRSTRMATPGYWVERYRYYRAEGARGASAALYCGLRAAGLTCYATGMMTAARERRRARS
jgi:glycosyltransferase involved in cell wall biosynthesis